MNKVKLSSKQYAMVKFLARIEKQGRTSFMIDEMGLAVYKPTGKFDAPKFPRNAITATIKALAFKLADAGGYRLRRVSLLGVGRKGEYEFAGDFARLLSEEDRAAIAGGNRD
jgi:hypothetical protein